MPKIKTFILKNKALFLILLFGLTPLFWFKGNLLIAGGDFPIPLDPAAGKFVQSFLYLWYPYLYGGEPNPHLFAFFPWFGFWALLKFLRLPLLLINKLWFVFVFTLSGGSMHYLVSVLFKKRVNFILLFIAPLFYMFNVYVMVVAPVMATPLLYGALPLILGLYIKGLREKSNKYVVLIALSSLLICAAIGNPPIYAILGIMVLSYFVYHLMVEGRSQIVPSLIFTLKIAVLYFLLNLWWFYPYLTNVLFHSRDIAKVIQSYPSLGLSLLLDNFRLLGSWAFFAGSGGADYFPFAHYYKTPVMILVTFLVPILAFVSAFFKPKGKVLYFFVMAVLGIMLANGSYASVNKLLFFIPGFWIFREPFAKFTAITALSFAILIGFSTWKIYDFIKLRKGLGLAGLSLLGVVLIILGSSWPMLTGDVIFSERGYMKSYHVQIPDYWFKTGEWFNRLKGDFRVLVLPENTKNYYCGLPYKWGYGSADIGPYLIHQPLIEERAGLGSSDGNKLSQSLTAVAYRSLRSAGVANPDIKPLIRLMNVKYVLQRNDVDWELIPEKNNYLYSPQRMKEMLATQKYLHLEEKVGDLDIYRVADDTFLPHLYLATNFTFFNGEMEGPSDTANFDADNLRVAVYTQESGQPTPEGANEIYIKAKMENPIDENKLNPAVVLQDVPFPYVKQRPGSLLHYLAIKKEKLKEYQLSRDSERLIDTQLFYAYKRIAELQEWGSDLAVNRKDIVKEYGGEIDQALTTLKRIKEENLPRFLPALNKFRVTLWAHEEKAAGLFLEEEVKNQLWAIFDQVESKFGGLRTNDDFSKMTYEFNVPREGNYEIYLQAEDNELTKIGEKEFKRGSQRLTLSMNRVSENLLDQNLTIKSFSPGSTYKVIFNYTAKEGGGGFAVVEDSGADGKWEVASLFKVGFPVTAKGYEMTFRSSPEASNAAVLLLSAQEEGQGVEYRKMEVRRIFQPNLVLRYSNVSQAGKTVPKMTFTKINPTKYKVKIEEVKEPYVLVFSESFNQGWKAYVKKGNSGPQIYSSLIASYFNGEIRETASHPSFLDKSPFEAWGESQIAEKRHKIVNGYANAWEILPTDADGRENYEVIIEFAPQKTYYYSLGILLLTFVGSLGFLIVKSIQRKG